MTIKPLLPDDPTQIGPFQLRARLGSGGMGVVYLGRTPGGRRVAVKVIHRELAAREPSFISRFRKEAQAAAKVGGAFTAAVITSDLENSPLWIATVYVEGPSLEETIETFGPLPEVALWRLTGGLIEALQAVHAAKLIHRDLKPSNVLLSVDGPQVIDFGISRAFQEGSTTQGRLIGTPAFMSPEQASGADLGPASDVFSLGSVIAYASTGRAIFEGPNIFAQINNVATSDPDLSGVPEYLRGLVEACLRKKPSERPSLDELMAIVNAQSPQTLDDATPFWPKALATFIASGDHTGNSGQKVSQNIAVAEPLTVVPESEPEPEPEPAPVFVVAEPLVVAARPAAEKTATGLARENGARTEVGSPTGKPAHVQTDLPIGHAVAERAPVDSPIVVGAVPGPPRRRYLSATTAGVVTAAVIVLLAVMLWPSNSPSGPPVAVSYALPTAHYSDGLAIKTRWSLSGANGTTLTETLTASDTNHKPLSLQYRQPVPTAVRFELAGAKFTPAAPMFVDGGQGLVWRLSVPASGHLVVSYRITIAGAGLSEGRLKRLVRGLTGVAPGPVRMHPAITLQALTIIPRSSRLRSGRSERLRLIGRLSNGQMAPASYLAKVSWTTTNRHVATVNRFGKVTRGPVAGRVKIIATVGSVATFAFVTVTHSNTAPGASNGVSNPGTTGPTAPSSTGSTSTTHQTSKPTSNPTTITPPPI